MYKTEIINNADDELLQEWETLWKNSSYANLENSPAWYKSAFHAFKYTDTKIVTIRESHTGELAAIAAFAKMKIFSIWFYTTPALEFAGKSQILADFENQKIISALFKGIREIKNVYLVNFTRQMLDRAQPFFGSAAQFNGNVEPFINFAQGPYGNLPGRKKNIVLNRMKNSGREFQIIASIPNMTEALETIFTIDTASVKNAKGKGVFHNEKSREFYRQIIKRSPANIIISLIYIDKKPVSYLLGFINNGIHSGSQKAYLAGFEYFALGRLLLIHLLDHFREKGSGIFELGHGIDGFKKDFTDKFHQYYNIIITSNSLQRRYISYIFALKAGIYPVLASRPNIYKSYKKLMSLFTFFRNKIQ